MAKRKLHDHYFKKAKAENYAARSVYKLQEINEKHDLLKRGMTVIDLGCAPGSWLQYAAPIIGNQGKLFGLDLQEVQISLPNCRTFVFDINDLFSDYPDFLPPKFDAVLSDAAPKTTGSTFADHVRSAELCHTVLDFCQEHLAPGGHLVMKIFQGEDLKGVLDRTRSLFEKAKNIKPKSSRDVSVEVFVVGRAFKQP